MGTRARRRTCAAREGHGWRWEAVCARQLKGKVDTPPVQSGHASRTKWTRLPYKVDTPLVQSGHASSIPPYAACPLSTKGGGGGGSDPSGSWRCGNPLPPPLLLFPLPRVLREPEAPERGAPPVPHQYARLRGKLRAHALGHDPLPLLLDEQLCARIDISAQTAVHGGVWTQGGRHVQVPQGGG